MAYATYPRSGNSLMRKYFENVTGTATGSDMVLHHQPNISLQFSGFKGEGICDDTSIWIQKTHYPLTFPFQPSSRANIAVICTRYQMDVDASFLYLIFTLSHNNTFKECLADDPIYPYWHYF